MRLLKIIFNIVILITCLKVLFFLPAYAATPWHTTMRYCEESYVWWNMALKDQSKAGACYFNFKDKNEALIQRGSVIQITALTRGKARAIGKPYLSSPRHLKEGVSTPIKHE